MSVTRGQHPGLRRIRDARGLRQPLARQAWAEDRLLERGDRRLTPWSTDFELERRVHFDPRSRANEDAAPTLARQAWAEDRLLERGDRRLSQVDPSLVARVINEGYA